MWGFLSQNFMETRTPLQKYAPLILAILVGMVIFSRYKNAERSTQISYSVIGAMVVGIVSNMLISEYNKRKSVQ